MRTARYNKVLHLCAVARYHEAQFVLLCFIFWNQACWISSVGIAWCLNFITLILCFCVQPRDWKAWRLERQTDTVCQSVSLSVCLSVSLLFISSNRISSFQPSGSSCIASLWCGSMIWIEMAEYWDHKTDGQTDRQTGRQTDRRRQRDRETNRQRGRQTERQRDRQTERQRDRQTDRQFRNSRVQPHLISLLAFCWQPFGCSRRGPNGVKL